MSSTSGVVDFLADPLLDSNARKARYGVVYLRALASQAGCTLEEMSPGEDVQAIDVKLGFFAGDVRVQIKTTQSFALDDTTQIGYTAHPSWIRSWRKLRCPIYFVVVVAPSESSSWLDHDQSGTRLNRTAAFWTRIDAEALGQNPRIHVSREQRLSAAVLADWEQDHDDYYSGLVVQ